MTDAPQAHSPWGASAAHRWMACPGSINLSRGLSSPSSVYAAEGTVAHAIGEACLRNPTANPGDFIGETITQEGFKIEVTEEMADAVEVYVQTVRTDQLLLGGQLEVEHRFDLSHLTADLRLPGGGSPPLFGRNDACLFNPDTGHLIAYDYKHGRGHPVEVKGNPQLRYYALGAVSERDKARKYRVKSIETAIVQPRAPHVDGSVRRDDSMDLFELQEWSADLVAAVKRTLEPDAPLVAGDHCLFCPAAARCPELHRQAQQLAVVDFQALQSKPPAPESLTMDQLVGVLNKADLVEEFISAVRHHAHTLASSGVPIPGHKLVAKRANRKFKGADTDVVDAVRRLAGDKVLVTDMFTDPELKSVAQLEAVLKKAGVLKDKKVAEAFATLYVKESSGTVLAPEADARPALPPPAVSDFAALGSAASILD